MDTDFLIRFLLWSMAFNYLILLVWFAAIVFGHGWVRRLHGRWFHMSDNTFDAIHYGGMAAYKEAGLDESKLTAIGFGFEGVVGREALLSGGPYKAACAMFPDYMGVSLIDAAFKAYKGEELPANYESGTVIITGDNFEIGRAHV